MSTSTTTPPLPSPPFHPIPNIHNLRDPALCPLTTPHGPIRPRILFRSADVSSLTLPDWTSLRALGIAHVFDLRSLPEVHRGLGGIINDGNDVTADWAHAMQQAGVARTWCPVFSEADYSPEGMAQRYVKYMSESTSGFVAAYEDILRSGGDAYAAIFKYLAALDPEKEQVGALVHCTAGKDRTGVFFALLFAFLGVPAQDIAAEYHLTELGLANVRDGIVQRLVQAPAFKAYIAGQMAGTPLSNEQLAELVRDDKKDEVEVEPAALEMGRQAALRMVGARKESMLGALEMLEREFGGAERYLREWCGLDDGVLGKLRRNLIVGAGGDE